MRALADSYLFWVAVFVALAVVCLLPTLIGIVRGVDRLALVFLVNLIGGAAAIGWPAAMILAFGPRRLPGPPTQSPPPDPGGPPVRWHDFYTITWRRRFRAERLDGGPALEADTTSELLDLMREDFHRRPARCQP